MKKSFGLLGLVLILACGCSLSALNPFADDEKVVENEQSKGVNHYLWQASLDKLEFMGLETADQRGGLIVTKWVKVDGSSNEMFKVEAKIWSRELRSDGLKVTVDKRQMIEGRWVVGKADKKLAIEIENRILMQARKLYRADLLINKG